MLDGRSWVRVTVDNLTGAMSPHILAWADDKRVLRDPLPNCLGDSPVRAVRTFLVVRRYRGGFRAFHKVTPVH